MRVRPGGSRRPAPLPCIFRMSEAGRPLQLPKPQPVQTPEQAGIVTVPGSDERVRVAQP
jgi:hypothetical protein